MTPIEHVAKALVRQRNNSPFLLDGHIDWAFISNNPKNQWYQFYIGQARAALLALADRLETEPDSDACIVKLRSIASEGGDDGKGQ